MLTARDPLDAQRMAAGFSPGASYPDGYLGTITNRREDRDLAVLQSRLTSTSYQRGVHKGEKIPTGDYHWSQDMNPEMGLQRQAQARVVNIEGGQVMVTPRASVTGDPVEMLAHDGKFAGASPREIERELRARGGDPAKNPVTVLDPGRAKRIRAEMPPWSGF